MGIPNAKPKQPCCPIVELRQYTLHPGQRDVLIDLFDREFVESQEALGMKIIGQFRGLGNPNRFVWLRGFRDMPSRAQALKDFYGGPVWKAHREAANATMIDSDNVLVLHPAKPTSGFSFGNKERPRAGANEARRELIVATIYYFDAPVDAGFVEFFEKTVKPTVIGSGATVLAFLVTEHSENTFPALPDDDPRFSSYARPCHCSKPQTRCAKNRLHTTCGSTRLRELGLRKSLDQVRASAVLRRAYT